MATRVLDQSQCSALPAEQPITAHCCRLDNQSQRIAASWITNHSALLPADRLITVLKHSTEGVPLVTFLFKLSPRPGKAALHSDGGVRQLEGSPPADEGSHVGQPVQHLLSKVKLYPPLIINSLCILVHIIVEDTSDFIQQLNMQVKVDLVYYEQFFSSRKHNKQVRIPTGVTQHF